MVLDSAHPNYRKITLMCSLSLVPKNVGLSRCTQTLADTVVTQEAALQCSCIRALQQTLQNMCAKTERMARRARWGNMPLSMCWAVSFSD